MEKILVAVDGSKNADKALAKAKQIGTALNSEITIIYVMEDIMAHPYVHIKDYDGSLNDAFREQGMKVLEAAMDDFKDYSGKVETLIERGNPGVRIVEVAEEGDYSLIIIGSRGLSAVSRAMLGSVSNKVVIRSKISVLIVK